MGKGGKGGGGRGGRGGKGSGSGRNSGKKSVGGGQKAADPKSKRPASKLSK